MDFRFVPNDPVYLVSCHILISKQDSTNRALRSNMRWDLDSAENRSQARDM